MTSVCNPSQLAVNDLIGDMDGFNWNISADEFYNVSLNGTTALEETNFTDIRLNGTYEYVHSYDLSTLLPGEYVIRAELEIMHAVHLGVGEERRTTLLVDGTPLGYLTDGYRLPMDINATNQTLGIARIDVFDLDLLLCDILDHQGDGMSNLTVTIEADDDDHWALDYSLLRIYTCDGYLDQYDPNYFSTSSSISSSDRSSKSKKSKKSKQTKSGLSKSVKVSQCKTKSKKSMHHGKMGMITKNAIKGRMYVRA